MKLKSKLPWETDEKEKNQKSSVCEKCCWRFTHLLSRLVACANEARVSGGWGPPGAPSRIHGDRGVCGGRVAGAPGGGLAHLVVFMPDYFL